MIFRCIFLTYLNLVSFYKKKSSFGDKPKSFGRGRSDRPSRDRDGEKKSFGFKGKKKFKGRNNRPKSFTFKKHSQKRAKI